MGILTYVPGSPDLLQALFLGAPKCARGTGDHLAESIISVCDRFIEKSQYRGLSADGVYGHNSVPGRLDRHYGRRTVYQHDLMHKAALVDTHMRKDVKFEWIIVLTNLIGNGVTFIQFGVEWHHFFQKYSDMVEKKEETRVLRPKTFSETKMANWAMQVYKRFREILPALVKTLREVQEEYYIGGASDVDKQLKANDIFGKIHTVTFLLSLSILIDIYRVFARISNNFQKINIFSFDRKDNFDLLLYSLQEMVNTVKVEECPCSTLFDYSEAIYLKGWSWLEGGQEEEQPEEEEEEEVEVENEVQKKKREEERKRRLAKKKEELRKKEALIAEVCEWEVFHRDIRSIKVAIVSNI